MAWRHHRHCRCCRRRWSRFSTLLLLAIGLWVAAAIAIASAERLLARLASDWRASAWLLVLSFLAYSIVCRPRTSRRDRVQASERFAGSFGSEGD